MPTNPRWTTVVRGEIRRRHQVAWVGEIERVRERFYAISIERRISHPAVRFIADRAKHRLFAGDEEGA